MREGSTRDPDTSRAAPWKSRNGSWMSLTQAISRSTLLKGGGEIGQGDDACGDEDVDDGNDNGHMRGGLLTLMIYSSNCIQPLSLSLSSALIQTPAIISWNASSAHAATKPTMARPVTSLSLAVSSSSPASASVGAWEALAEGTAPSGWVGGWRLTVALGNPAVAAAAAGSGGLVAEDGEVENAGEV